MMWSKVAAWSGWRHGVGRVHVCGGVCGNSGAGLGEVVSAGLGEAVG